MRERQGFDVERNAPANQEMWLPQPMAVMERIRQLYEKGDREEKSLEIGQLTKMVQARIRQVIPKLDDPKDSGEQMMRTLMETVKDRWIACLIGSQADGLANGGMPGRDIDIQLYPNEAKFRGLERIIDDWEQIEIKDPYYRPETGFKLTAYWKGKKDKNKERVAAILVTRHPINRPEYILSAYLTFSELASITRAIKGDTATLDYDCPIIEIGTATGDIPSLAYDPTRKTMWVIGENRRLWPLSQGEFVATEPKWLVDHPALCLSMYLRAASKVGILPPYTVSESFEVFNESNLYRFASWRDMITGMTPENFSLFLSDEGFIRCIRQTMPALRVFMDLTISGTERGKTRTIIEAIQEGRLRRHGGDNILQTLVSFTELEVLNEGKGSRRQWQSLASWIVFQLFSFEFNQSIKKRPDIPLEDIFWEKINRLQIEQRVKIEKIEEKGWWADRLGAKE
jgi:hypothetical protein